MKFRRVIPAVLGFTLLFGAGTSNAMAFEFEGRTILEKNTYSMFEAQSTTLAKFSDVPTNFWAYTEIQFLLNEGIAEPLSGTNYAPNDQIKRSDAAKMLVKALKINVEDPSIPDVSFPDLPKSHKDYKYIKAAVSEGIFKGKNDGTFGVNESLTRGQMAKVLVETFELQGIYPMSFKDVTSKHWAKDYVSKLAASEVTNGYHDLTYKPENKTTRAQMAVFIYRAINGSPFNDPNLRDYATNTDFKVENGVVLFGNNVYGTSHYLPSTKVNPFINRQVYNTAKVLLDKDNYMLLSSTFDNGNYVESRVDIVYGINSGHVNNRGGFFHYILNDVEYHTLVLQGFSQKRIITLYLNSLWFDYFKMNKEDFSEPYYKQKFKDSLVAMFGSDGEKMYPYIMQKYIDSINDKEIKETKIFNNLRLDVQTNFRGGIIVGFSFVD